MGRLRLATIWLGGCSGCHMSFLDIDEFLIDLAGLVDVVYSPLVDTKVYPKDVDVVLIEGAAASEEHIDLARLARKNTKKVVAFGDCAVTGNVTAMRNHLGPALVVLERAYLRDVDVRPGIPCEPGIVPVLLDRVRPLHEVIPVDGFIPGCPPPAKRIKEYLESTLANR